MKKENVSATFQGFRDFILHASTRAGSREKLHITTNIILKILKILQILLPTPAVRTSSFVLQNTPAAEENGSL